MHFGISTAVIWRRWPNGILLLRNINDQINLFDNGVIFNNPEDASNTNEFFRILYPLFPCKDRFENLLNYVALGCFQGGRSFPDALLT